MKTQHTIKKQEAANKNMEIIQAKLQECIDKGTMNSFEKLSKQFNSDSNNSDMEDSNKNDAPDINVDAMSMDTDTNAIGKSEDKIPVKRRKKIHQLPNTPGQTGAKLARQKINKMKRGGKMRKGQVVQKNTAKRKKGKVHVSF